MTSEDIKHHLIIISPFCKTNQILLKPTKQENWSHQNILKTDISLVGHYIFRDLHVDPMSTKWQVISLICFVFSLGCFFYQDANSRVHGMRGSFHGWGKHIKEQEIRSMVRNLLKENPWQVWDLSRWDLRSCGHSAVKPTALKAQLWTLQFKPSSEHFSSNPARNTSVQTQLWTLQFKPSSEHFSSNPARNTSVQTQNTSVQTQLWTLQFKPSSEHFSSNPALNTSNPARNTSVQTHLFTSCYFLINSTDVNVSAPLKILNDILKQRHW